LAWSTPSWSAVAGFLDVTLQIYPGARHELFNETNRDDVFADQIAGMNSKVRHLT
jgi:alpha-beta hydrolase superfamily lysophospholipase